MLTVRPSLRKIAPEGHGKLRMLIHGRWSDAAGTAVGCANYGNYRSNPRHRLILHKAAHVLLDYNCLNIDRVCL